MKNVSLTNTLTENQISQTSIEGDLTIKNSTEIKDELLHLLNHHQQIEIYFKNISSIDISILQLLVALHKTASAQQKNINYHFEDSEYLTAVLNNSGYHKFFSTHVQ